MFTGLELILVKAILVGAAATAVAYWPKIIEWSRNSLLPLIDKHFPSMSEHAMNALVKLDNIAVGLRRAARIAWGHLKQVFLGQIITITKHSHSQRVITVVNYLKNFRNNDKPYIKITTQEYVNRYELPEEIRAQELKEGAQEIKINTWNMQEKMLETT